MSEILAYDHECPNCGASVGYACHTLNGGTLASPHMERVQLTIDQACDDQSIKKALIKRQQIIEPTEVVEHINIRYGCFELPTDTTAYKIECVVAETDKAILFKNPEGLEFWIPKSCILKFDSTFKLIYTHVGLEVREALPKGKSHGY